MILADLEIQGRTRKGSMQAPKNGFFYVLARESGERLSAKAYTTVNWASRVDPETGRPVETANARLFDGEQVAVPSNGGGHNWPDMSYSERRASSTSR
jgi:glucose dehydrogenase